MSVSAEDSIINWIQKFCGQEPHPHEYIASIDGHPCFPSTGMGHSQLNELLLSLHLDRASEGFFHYVFQGPVVRDFETFRKCISKFRITAILHYGNIKFAFKRLSQMARTEIDDEIGRSNSEEIRYRYTKRHEPLVSIKGIAAKDTYYLGSHKIRNSKQRNKNWKHSACLLTKSMSKRDFAPKLEKLENSTTIVI